MSRRTEVRLPLIAVTADRIKANDNMHRIQARVIPYSLFRFSASNSARCLYIILYYIILYYIILYYIILYYIILYYNIL